MYNRKPVVTASWFHDDDENDDLNSVQQWPTNFCGSENTTTRLKLE